MPKVVCLCKEVINLSDIPSPNQLLMIEDVKYDKYFDSINAEELYKEMTLVVKCSNCKRLYVYESGFENQPLIYNLERPN